MKFYMDWWKRLWLFMCSLQWQNLYQPHVHLTYGCQKGYIMSLLWLLILLFIKWEAKHVTIGLFEVNETIVQLWI